jgi:hypothetical protein
MPPFSLACFTLFPYRSRARRFWGALVGSSPSHGSPKRRGRSRGACHGVTRHVRICARSEKGCLLKILSLLLTASNRNKNRRLVQEEGEPHGAEGQARAEPAREATTARPPTPWIKFRFVAVHGINNNAGNKSMNWSHACVPKFCSWRSRSRTTPWTT